MEWTLGARSAHIHEPFLFLFLSGVWWQRLVPLIHQHLSRPAVRPAGTGAHLRWTRCGCWFGQPLLQSLPLSAIAHLFSCVYMYEHTVRLYSREGLEDFALILFTHTFLSLCHLCDFSSYFTPQCWKTRVHFFCVNGTGFLTFAEACCWFWLVL